MGARPCALRASIAINHRSANSPTDSFAGHAVLKANHDLGGLPFANLLQDRIGDPCETSRAHSSCPGAALARFDHGREPRERVVEVFRRSLLDALGTFRRLDAMSIRRPSAVERSRNGRPVWHAMPGSCPSCFAFISTVVSQSSSSLVHLWMWPLSSPLCQADRRERLKYTASPSSTVWPVSPVHEGNIQHVVLPTSCAIAGTRPFASHFTASSQFISPV